MGLLGWLKGKLFRSKPQPANNELMKWREEVAEFLARLSRNLTLDAHVRRYLTHYIIHTRLQVKQGRSVLFGPDAGIDELAAEGAYQGFLDPKARGDACGVVLRDDLLMRLLVYFAEHGNVRSASGVRSFAAGTFNKRSQVRGTEEARRIARQFVERHG